MQYRKIGLEELSKIFPDYINYFNSYESGEWNQERIERKFKQLVDRYDYVGIGLFIDDRLIGFALGCLIQFDDGIVAKLEELFITHRYQSKGYGSQLLKEFEKTSKALGAFRIQLESANDKVHNRFYNQMNNYQDAGNNILKAKML